jgi:penicillin amidase
VARVVLLLVTLALGLGGAAAWMVGRTLPPDDERRSLAGLDGPVTIDYDDRGVPTIRAGTLHDLAFAQGWVHARDRRFQMALMRRSAAGRLAELFGARALPADREARLEGFGAIAESCFAHMGPERRARLQAYADGVNAWDRVHPAPPEFLAIGIPREPWRAQDYALVILSMFSDLQLGGDHERMVETMDATLPRALVDFLTPSSMPMDAPLDGRPFPPAPRLPTPAEFDTRVSREAETAALSRSDAIRNRAEPDPYAGEPARGSNNWVIAPARTASGHAIVCNDMHLALRVPTLWHLERLEGPGVAITGVTLPGGPDVVVGSNDRVAWGFTNVEGDFVDWVHVRPAPADTSSYLGPDGPERFHVRREIIRVKGAPAETLSVRETRWGPVIGRARADGWLVLQWGALDPSSCDFDMLDEARAGSLAELFRAFDSFRGPAQNCVAADAAGHIGWRIIGRLPRREGFDPRRPREGARRGAGWDGWIPQDSMPRVIDPPSGFLATANQRTVGGRAWQWVGDGCAPPWRARRIADVLASRSNWTVAGAESLQNDVDDAMLGTFARALDRALSPARIGTDTTLAAARRLVDRWDHRADTTSASHAFLRYVRVAMRQALLRPLVAPCVARDSSFSYDWNLQDEVARRLLEERPVHLLDPRFPDYDALACAAADTAAVWLRARMPGVPLERIVWGRINRARIRHPLGAAAPALAAWLNYPSAALAGGSMVVRVANPTSGASERMVVEMGNPAAGRFALPGGESGHFLSTHYGDGFADWVAGRYVPFEPGRARHEIRLEPGR